MHKISLILPLLLLLLAQLAVIIHPLVVFHIVVVITTSLLRVEIFPTFAAAMMVVCDVTHFPAASSVVVQ